MHGQQNIKIRKYCVAGL